MISMSSTGCSVLNVLLLRRHRKIESREVLETKVQVFINTEKKEFRIITVETCEQELGCASNFATLFVSL